MIKTSKIFLFFSLFLLPALASADSLSDRLGNIFSTDSSSDEILDPEVAFLFNSEVIDGENVRLTWQIEEGYYLYQNRFAFETRSEGVQVGNYLLPDGKEKQDPAFGRVVVNTGLIEIILPFTGSGGNQQNVEMQVAYQGCKEDSICYPPIKKLINFVLPEVMAKNTGNISDPESDATTTVLKLSEQDAITKQLSEKSLVVNLLVFFGFGLLLALTPCVFPMIPILSGIIVGQGKDITTRHAFILSLVYVLAMALTYAVLGVIAGSFHFNLQAASQNVWVISAFSAVFVLLALSMFGFYELQLPNAIQNRLSALSNKQTGGSLHGAAIMGVLSAIIVGPCVAPPLAGALFYISQTGNALFGGLALFSMGLGFGVPLLIIGTSAGKLLPKAGQWMATVKAAFGIVMLAVAIWFLERILPGPVTLIMWATLFIVTAIYMGALDRLESSSRWPRLWKGLGLVLFVYGGILIVAATMGGKDVLNPLNNISFGLNSNEQQATNELAFKKVKSLEDLKAELIDASVSGKAVMLDFYADWCVVCKEMEKYTFSNPGVQTILQDVVLLKADVTDNDDIDQALLKHFDLFGPPAILFFGDDAEERLPYRLVGFVEADTFISHIIKATAL